MTSKDGEREKGAFLYFPLTTRRSDSAHKAAVVTLNVVTSVKYLGQYRTVERALRAGLKRRCNP